MRRLFATLFFSFSFLSATEYAPWYGRSFEIEARLKGTYANYPRLEGEGHCDFKHADDFFLDGSLSGTIYDNYNVEFEIGGSDTKLHDFEGHYVSLTGRTLWLNDVVDDPLSLSTGLTIRKVWKHAVPDFLPQHHGKYEFEAHVSLGKEFICEDDWYSRIWGMFLLGYGSQRGSPYLKAEMDYDYKFLDYFLFTALAKAFYGLGSRDLDDFKGRWASINHQAIDLGIRLSYLAEDFSILYFEYNRRVHAKNAPTEVNCFQVCYMYPFGL